MRHLHEGLGTYATAEKRGNGAKEKLLRCLESHIVDVNPQWIGSDKIRTTYAGNTVAAIESSISRCEPPLLVPKAAARNG